MYEVEIAELKRLAEFIKTQYNYDFTNYAMSSFRRRVQRVIELYKFKNVDWLINRFMGDEQFFNEFVSEITVNVTEMFRDPSFWRELRDQIVPNLLLNHDHVKIWHAGCSSGEEVYSMAILLHEMGLSDRVTIIATDLDRTILDKAKRGEYAVRNMELNQKNYIRFQGKTSLDDYYTIKNDKVYMNPELVKNVQYREHDLVRGVVFNKFDLILCRNVMIYFNQNLQNQVLTKLHESLFRYGYLAIGAKESLIWCDVANKFIVVNNEEKMYKKYRD